MEMRSGRAEALNSRFGMPGMAFRVGPGGLVLVEVESQLARAQVALQGAQVLSWTPRHEEPVIWLSEAARFAPGIPIRGGVPICWPWFGPHASDPALPQHGFARTAEWQMVAAERLFDGRIRLTFRLPDDCGASVWSHRAELIYMVTVGQTLELDLVTRNTGAEAIVLGQALHAYFCVGDYKDVTVHGLEGCRYLDKVSGDERLQDRPLMLSGKTDRVYLDVTRDCVIEDPALGRALRITKRNSHSAIVWNPALSGDSPGADFGTSGSRHMLCVETANAAEDVVRLEPRAVHLLFSRFSVEALG